MHRRLNTRGKIAVSILLTVIIVLLSGLIGNNEKKASDPKLEDSLKRLSFSSEPVATFSDSKLGQSIVEWEIETREALRKEEAAKQNQIDQQENAVYLTFDDGPSDVTGQLMDILNDYEMQATFFMLGPRIKEYPDAVKRMHQEGHGLALHGITHKLDRIYSSTSSPSLEMIEDQAILESTTGVRSDIIRLPYGSFPYLTEEMRYRLWQHGFQIWDWNVDSLDWEFNNRQYVQHTIQEIEKVKQIGEIPNILLHDRQETVNYLPELLSYIKSQGYKTKVLTNEMPPLTFQCEGRCRPVSNSTVGR
ncbi:polysaccharide deacetylase family protein [Niallia sp. XMNu-256]|uniref:polysaccharide deacetylase family protein n=1 Tax=Niallia sp. XMNu-256 TaxID=3082444 RepID=UPI0030CAB6B2